MTPKHILKKLLEGCISISEMNMPYNGETTEINEEQVSLLNILESYIESGISYACIVDTEDLYHEEDECIVRAFTFNKGMREQIVVLGADTHIYSNIVMSDRPVSKRLIRDLIPILAEFYIDFLLEEEE